MSTLLVIVGVILLLFVLLLLFAAISWLMSVLGGVQFVQTPRALFPVIVELARLTPGEQFVELGSGAGELCRYVGSKTAARAIGIDINPLLTFYARWRAKDNPDTSFVFGNYRSYPLDRVDVVYCYLLPYLMKKTGEQFARQLKPGARVICYAFPIPDKQPTQVVHATPDHAALYLYEY